MRLPEGEGKQKGTEEIFETVTESFPKLLSDTKPQTQSSENTKQGNTPKNYT